MSILFAFFISKALISHHQTQAELSQLKSDRAAAVTLAADSASSASAAEKAESAAAIAAFAASTKALEDKLADLKSRHEIVVQSLAALGAKVDEEKVKLPATEDAIKVQ